MYNASPMLFPRICLIALNGNPLLNHTLIVPPVPPHGLLDHQKSHSGFGVER